MSPAPEVKSPTTSSKELWATLDESRLQMMAWVKTWFALDWKTAAQMLMNSINNG
jgi:hypothetical protein